MSVVHTHNSRPQARKESTWQKQLIKRAIKRPSKSAMITVGTLAERLSIPISRLIAELMKNGVMATAVSRRIDFDTAQIIVEVGLEVTLVRQTQLKKPAPTT